MKNLILDSTALLLAVGMLALAGTRSSATAAAYAAAVARQPRTNVQAPSGAADKLAQAYPGAPAPAISETQEEKEEGPAPVLQHRPAKEVHPMIRDALKQLHATHHMLKFQAANDFNGHKRRAELHISQAMDELRECLKIDK